MSYLILVRHGQSTWNLEKKFTGWVDVDLTENGKLEAKKSGELIKSKNINIKILNNLNLKKIDNIRFPVIKILNNLSNEDSLFETIIVSANDKLVKLFLNNKIKFTDISNTLLKICNTPEFNKFKSIKPRNIEEIHNLSDYVSLKISSMSV